MTTEADRRAAAQGAKAQAAEPEAKTRMIVMGSSALTQGFTLIGFETWGDASPDDVERVLAELLRRRERAMVLLEPDLARCASPSLKKIYAEGGHIVVTEVPPLHAPREYHPEVEELVASVLGSAALEETP